LAANLEYSEVITRNGEIYCGELVFLKACAQVWVFRPLRLELE